MMTMKDVAVALALGVFLLPSSAFAPTGSSLAAGRIARPGMASKRTQVARLKLKTMAVPPPADFKGYWDKVQPAYDSSTRHPRYSNQDWLTNLKDLVFLRSKMLKRISSHLIANTVWAGVVFFLFQNVPAVTGFCAGMNPTAHSLAAGALSLLLVFRTNSAYDRFWEGRKLWGKLVNMTRELARLGHQYLRGNDREHYLALCAAFPAILMQHLQGKENTYRPSGGLYSEAQRTALHGLLGDGPMKLLWESRNRPFTVTKMMGAIVSDGMTSPAKVEKRFGKIDFDGDSQAKLKANLIMSQLTAERRHMELMISDYANVYGACERIIKSAVPTSYSAHTSRMLSVWAFTLPLALVGSLGWRMIPAVGIICWMLFTIEEVGHSIEDPFNLHVLDSKWLGKEDQLRIEASLNVLRGDVLERIPATDPSVYTDTKTQPFTARDYDPAQFHWDWEKTAK
mmetsp:Transcript_16434/g.38043  ORF Transcript_16434/g.38043 Transcript_16434/m.38043 type:complete len:454 (+) Transcript_16434:41-1402(+)